MLATAGLFRLDLLRSPRVAGKRSYAQRQLPTGDMARLQTAIAAWLDIRNNVP